MRGRIAPEPRAGSRVIRQILPAYIPRPHVLTPISLINDTTWKPENRHRYGRRTPVEKHKLGTNNLLGKKMLKVYGMITFSIFLMFAVAMLGKYHNENPNFSGKLETVQDVHNSISDFLINEISGQAMKKNLRKLTKEPHLAGTEANKKVAKTIAHMWNEAGLEDVHMIPYEVLLSYPNFEKPNTVTIQSAMGHEVFKSKGYSPVLIPDEQGGKNAGIQWLAYSAPGRVTAEVVYCNRGSEEDFENLKKMGIDVKGKIAMMRYGEGFRGDKVYKAQHYGATGAILFSDPSDVARDGVDTANVYPKKFWMPGEGVQRGSVMHGDGDPMTPLYPAKSEMFKSRTVEEAKKAGTLPSIPVLPVSYSTAYEILSRMKGRPVPLSWQGFVNVTYRTGPGLANDHYLSIDVHSTLQTKQIRNVVGYIRGSAEPDRYVILGNHFDAWVYGSIDPNSGTAILAEVARAMMKTVNETGWRPARTIMFTAWDAEEYGLLGSTEFVEEFVNVLQQRAVVYLNMDCIQGNTSLHVNTVPSIYRAAVEAAKKIPNPNKKERSKGRTTLYDSWVKTFPSHIPGKPLMDVPSGGSDHAPFLNFAGVPVVDFNFKNATTYDTYPLYHTLYETPFTNEHLLDGPDFAIHRATGQYWAELARMFIDDVVLPFNSTELSISMLKEYLPELRTTLVPLLYYKDAIQPAKDQLLQLTKATQDFYHMARKFEQSILFARNAFAQNPYDSRNVNAINERQMGVSRCFINPRGIPGSPQSRHVLFSVSDKDSYASRVMAGVYDAVDAFKSAKIDEDRFKFGRELAQQINIVQYSVHCATSTLKEII